ncbi:substrate-binding periplasmic protein [Vibrio coralliilyticus]|uniref:substrate-binding periplasmic protein n=1 Tax=Vibrio coralliilyticus TaxID=190893 RepID=UPI002409922E|nr:transporter substrate-binding domain-containing protein [Vibrio coralliilyticus]WFB50465.1 transporter substrate-binding domain-containing protein [Vibrio coralliilyticus]
MKRMYSLLSLLIALSASFSSVSVAGSSDDLRELSFFTESYPPANYMEGDKITGYAVEILLAASKMVGEEIDMSQVTLQPWARSYRTVLTHDNSVLFSTTRSEHRETLFNWVGPIADIKIVVLARKDADITIEKPMDMANYRIGVIRDDIGEQTLLAMGLPRNSMQEANYVTTLAEQLMKKRIDLLVYAHRAAIWWSKQAEVDPSLFESVYVVREGLIYYAFNVDVKPEVLAKLQKGVDMLKNTKGQSGKSLYQEIMDKYER